MSSEHKIKAEYRTGIFPGSHTKNCNMQKATGMPFLRFERLRNVQGFSKSRLDNVGGFRTLEGGYLSSMCGKFTARNFGLQKVRSGIDWLTSTARQTSIPRRYSSR